MVGLVMPETTSRMVRYGFYLPEGFSLIALGASVDPLRIANMVVGEELFRYSIIGESLEIVRSSDGIGVAPDGKRGEQSDLDALFIVGPNPLPKALPLGVSDWLRDLARQGIALGGIDTGSYYLAKAGLLNGYRCTIHWEDQDILRETFPALVVSDRIYEVDRDRYTCSGGVSPLDMMAYLIKLVGGVGGLGTRVLEMLIADVRSKDHRQPRALQHYLGPRDERLGEALKVMLSNVEEKIGLKEVAGLAGLSQRQMERIFQARMGKAPSQVYTEVRLQRGRQLVCRTGIEIEEIARRVGFLSASHFTSRYRELFGCTPSADRLSYNQR